MFSPGRHLASLRHWLHMTVMMIVLIMFIVKANYSAKANRLQKHICLFYFDRYFLKGGSYMGSRRKRSRNTACVCAEALAVLSTHRRPTNVNKLMLASLMFFELLCVHILIC